MDTTAAVLWGTHRPWSVEDIIVDPPKHGEVLVELAASGLCHSEEHIVTGDLFQPPELCSQYGTDMFPIIGGHEGAGVVAEVGPGVPASSPETTSC